VKRNKKEIMHYLSNKYNLPIKKIEQMVNYQFKYVSNVINLGKFEGVRIPYFGLFSVNPNRVKHLTKLKNKKNKI
jgi:nucleoid DNA-binding protein